MDTSKSVALLMENAGPIIKYRVEKEFLGKDRYSDYRRLILCHPLVREARAWQQDDGYLGIAFHGGWLPENKKIRSSRAAEAALRFLAETGLRPTEPFLDRALTALCGENYNRSPSCWDIFCPEEGLYGSEYERDMLLALFNKAEDNTENSSIALALDRMKYLASAGDISDFSYAANGRRFFVKGKALPDLYQLRLLSCTRSWRNAENIETVAAAVRKYIELSPLPPIYILHHGQRIAPAAITCFDFSKNLADYSEIDWYQFLSLMQLFSDLGLIDKVDRLNGLFRQLSSMVERNGGILDLPVCHKVFKVWGAYSGLMLEERWKGSRRSCDLTYRYLKIVRGRFSPDIEVSI